MALSIQLPTTACQAGSPVVGTIQLQGTNDVDVIRIGISLTVRCKAKATKNSAPGSKRDIHRGRSVLFQQSQELFKGPRTLHPGHSWEFGFQLPGYVDTRFQHQLHNNRDPFSINPGQAFDQSERQPLPPSMTARDDGATHSYECYVQYELEAKLVAGKPGFFSRESEKETTRNLTFHLPRTIEYPDPQTTSTSRWYDCTSVALTRQGHDTDPAIAAAGITFKERLKWLGKTKPSAPFTFRVHYPLVAVAGQPLPLQISIEHDEDRATVSSKPAVYLRKVTVELVAATTMKCTDCTNPFTAMTSTGQLFWWDSKLVLATRSFAPPAPSSPSNDMPEPPKPNNNLLPAPQLSPRPALLASTYLAQPAITIPSPTTPTFATTIISRTHKLRVKASLECAGKKFDAEMACPGNLMLLSNLYADPGGIPGTVPVTSSTAAAAAAAAAATTTRPTAPAVARQQPDTDERGEPAPAYDYKEVPLPGYSGRQPA